MVGQLHSTDVLPARLGAIGAYSYLRWRPRYTPMQFPTYLPVQEMWVCTAVQGVTGLKVKQ